MTLASGTRLGPFEIVSPVGAGGMGEIYKARDARLSRDVALKVLPADCATDRVRLGRFAQEARAASALNHPNIVTIFEIGDAETTPYIAMEFVDGRTLRSMIGGAPLTLRTALQIASQLADGLAKAHEAGIVHRDLKPDNIMVTRDGFAKILDFGVAKLAGGLQGGESGPFSHLTDTGFVVGTTSYMSPEQAAGKPVDGRSDQFSLGLILYEMLTGRKAFDRPTVVQTLSAIIQEDPEPVERLSPRVPAPVLWILGRLLAKDPEERYAATRDLARELKQLRDNLPAVQEITLSRAAAASARPRGEVTTPRAATRMTAAATAPTVASPPRRLKAERRRAGGLLPLLAAGLVFFAAGAGAGWWFRGKATDKAPRDWQGELLLGGATAVFSPRVSPDGQTVAFVTLQNGVSQVALLRPASGDWTVLTHQKGVGSIYKLAWARDGSKIYFDRVTDVPHAVYSIPAIGGEERLVLPDAEGPEPLPDGSLLVVKLDADRNFQPHRLWPETGKLESVGLRIAAESMGVNLYAFADGRDVLFWGRLASDRDERIRRAYLLEVETGKVRPLAPELSLSAPLGVASDGTSVLGTLVSGDLFRIAQVSRDGTVGKVLLTLSSRPRFLSAAADGALFVDTKEYPTDVLRFPVTGGIPERLASAGSIVMCPVELGDGRLVVPSEAAGRRRLLVASADGSLRRLVDTQEQAAPPVAPVAGGAVAFLLGGVDQRPLLAVASIEEGRILRRFDATSGSAPVTLAPSPDGRTLYYADAGDIWTLDVATGTPRKLRPGHGVAIDARRGSMIVQVNGRSGSELREVPLAGGPDRPIPFTGPLRLAPVPIAPGAVGPDGRIAVTVATKDSWFWGAALLDPTTGTVERIPVSFEGDVQFPTFFRDGSLRAVGIGTRSALWRFRAREEAAAK
ncbi:MAG: protein kinase domain-containing protein [Acidithiobacillales bacterium]